MKPTDMVASKPKTDTLFSSQLSEQKDTRQLLSSESESSEHTIVSDVTSLTDFKGTDEFETEMKNAPEIGKLKTKAPRDRLRFGRVTYCMFLVMGLVILVTLVGIFCNKVTAYYYSSDVIEMSAFPMDYEVYAPEMEPEEQCAGTCTFSLVESIPQNLTYNGTHNVHVSTYIALKTLMASATKSVQIASFYWTLLGDDISYHDDTATQGEDIFNGLLDISKNNKISLQIAQNAQNNDTDTLAKEGHAEVRTLNFTHLLGSGILHTKFWLVDGQHFYLGSANLDWRSLTQVKELGVLVQNCPCLGADLQKIFDVYWYLGQPNAKVPHNWPAQYNTSINQTNPIIVPFNNTKAPVFISSSPSPLCPGGRTSDIMSILHVIGTAKQYINIAVMDYSPATLYMDNNVSTTAHIGPRYWPVIDDALREAAFNHHVTVRLLASKWKHTMKDMYTFLCSLKMMSYIHDPRTRIEVKVFEVPASQEQAKIPFARVNHNKYMVTDQHAYIGTSNWSGDYFISTAGVGFIVEQPGDSVNDTNGNFRAQLYEVFMRDWESGYAENVTCFFDHQRPTHTDYHEEI